MSTLRISAVLAITCTLAALALYAWRPINPCPGLSLAQLQDAEYSEIQITDYAASSAECGHAWRWAARDPLGNLEFGLACCECGQCGWRTAPGGGQ